MPVSAGRAHDLWKAFEDELASEVTREFGDSGNVGAAAGRYSMNAPMRYRLTRHPEQFTEFRF